MSEPALESENLLAFLSTPSSFPHHPERVEIRQTHASIVALAPPFVYKVKKAVDLGFLDFTTLTKRQANCERELALNSRLCPEIYLGVVPLYLRQGKLTFQAHGQPVEFALKMKQLPDGYFLNQLIRNGKVRTAHLELLAEVLVPFYTQQPECPEIVHFGDVESIQLNSDENFTTLQHYPAERVPPLTLDTIRFYTHAFLQTHSALFRKRMLQQRIKDCHGDLHTEHIHIQDKKVCIYDCLEFNERFRYSDVGADIAFLAMDFDFLGRPDLSTYVVDLLAKRLEDPDLLRLIDFYKCYRATVRAKVELLRANELEVIPQEREKSLKRARKYLQLALQYATVGVGPYVWIVCGKVGSGKSTLATELAYLLGATYLSSDIIRKESAGLPLYARTSDEKRKELYAAEQTEHVYQTLREKALTVVRLGRSAVVDATFGNPIHRSAMVAVLQQTGIPYYFVEVEATEPVVRQRLAQRENVDFTVSDARLSDYETLTRTYSPPKEIDEAHLLYLSTQDRIDKTIALLLRQVSCQRHGFPVEINP